MNNVTELPTISERVKSCLCPLWIQQTYLIPLLIKRGSLVYKCVPAKDNSAESE